ncbi:MAG: septation protein IspZ [Gammaproteobacteria bacterium]|nr:septation protein IspZ [Gammaproteobacteria bacterium]
MNMIFEFFPLLLFLGTLLLKDIYAAVIVLMVTMPIGLAIKSFRSGSVDKMYLWSTVFALAFGGLTLYFRNPYFTYWKPTAFYWAVGFAFLLSTWLGEKPLAQRFFGLVEGMNLEKITPPQWKRLNLVWVLFFVVAGLLNIYVAYNYSEKTWATFKVFGLMAFTFVFIAAQTFWIAGIIGDDDTEAE